MLSPSSSSPVGEEPCRRGPVDPLADSRWDERLAAYPAASFFHGTAWARVLVETYGFQPLYFVREYARGERDILPLFEVDSWLTGRRGVSLPFTDECAPLCARPEGFAALWADVAAYAAERRWKTCELRGGRAWTAPHPASTSFYGHTLDLRAGEAALFAQTDSATRRAIRKAEKSGVVVEFSSDLDAVQQFYALLCQTRRRHGLPPQPFRFFAAIQRHVLAAGHGFVALARHEGRTVAGAVFFHRGPAALYKFGASDETFQQLRGNNLVMWRAIERLARQGCASLDFGRTSVSNTGLRAYKLAWGTVERQVEYTTYDFRRQAYVVQPDRASGGWHHHAFRLMPLPLARAAGAMLYRHIA